jgi:hypothetical protein
VTAAPGQGDQEGPAPGGRQEPGRGAPPGPPGTLPGGPVVIDVRGLGAGGPGQGAADGGPGLGAVAALARLGLAARRSGHRVRLRGAAPELRRLLELAGLAGEFEWEPEQGEEAGGVQE